MQKIQHTIFIWSLLCGCIQHALFGCTFRRAVMSITEPWLGPEKRENIMIQLYLLSEVRFCKCGVIMTLLTVYLVYLCNITGVSFTII